MLNGTQTPKINSLSRTRVNCLKHFLNLEQEWLQILNGTPRSESQEFKRAEALASVMDSVIRKKSAVIYNPKN